MINRTGSAYIDLPEFMHERRCKTVKLQLSITVNCPPSLEKKYKKLIDQIEQDAVKSFNKSTKKIVKKAAEDSGLSE